MRQPAGQITASGLLSSTPPVHLLYRSGARADAPLFPAAIAVIRDRADVVDKQGNLIPPTVVVICKRLMLPALGFKGPNRFAVSKLRMGAPVEAIQAGEGHNSAILKWSTEHAPTVFTECCRGVGACSDADASCGSCCNNHNGRHVIPVNT